MTEVAEQPWTSSEIIQILSCIAPCCPQTLTVFVWIKMHLRFLSNFVLVLPYVFLWFEIQLGAHRGKPCCVGVTLSERFSLFEIVLHLTTLASLKVPNASRYFVNGHECSKICPLRLARSFQSSLPEKLTYLVPSRGPMRSCSSVQVRFGSKFLPEFAP